jgi:hypothetical protein
MDETGVILSGAKDPCGDWTATSADRFLPRHLGDFGPFFKLRIHERKSASDFLEKPWKIKKPAVGMNPSRIVPASPLSA